MEKLKQLLFCASLELKRAWNDVETQRQLQEARLLHLEELLTTTRRERDEAREQLLKLEAEFSNTQRHVVTSSDRSHWPDTKLGDEFCWNSTSAHQFDLPPDVHFSNLMELQDEPLYYDSHEQQLSFVEPRESEKQRQQEVESHLLASTPSMSTHMPERPGADFELNQSALPERGKLLQTVLQAGPLLQTLLLTGQLPKWRNPPPGLDSLKIPETGQLPKWRNPPPGRDSVEIPEKGQAPKDSAKIPKISKCFSSNSLPVGPMAHHVSNPHDPADALDPLQVNSAVSSYHERHRPRKRINETLSTSLQSCWEAASSSSKLSFFVPVLNSMDSSVTASRPPKFPKRH